MGNNDNMNYEDKIIYFANKNNGYVKAKKIADKIKIKGVK